MHRILSLVIFVFCSFASIGQGINFETSDWQDALEKAKSEGKILFIDAYAQWCGPCKVMAKTTFKDEKVGTFFNDNFINLKLDMETPNGRTFSVKYPVSAYPTLYFLDGDGEIVKKVVGGQKVPGLLKHAEAAIKGAINLEALAEEYEAGERGFEFMLSYIQALSTVGKPNLKLANDYLDSNPQWTNEERVRFLFESTSEADSRLFEMMVKEKDLVIELYGATKFEEKIKSACSATVEKAIDYEMESLLAEATTKAQLNLETGANLYVYESSTNYFTAFNLADQYLNSAVEYAKTLEGWDSKEMEKLVGEMCANYPKNDAVLSKAVELSKAQYKKSKDITSLKLYCSVLHLTNDGELALKTAKKALKKEKDKDAKMEIEKFIEIIQKNLAQ